MAYENWSEGVMHSSLCRDPEQRRTVKLVEEPPRKRAPQFVTRNVDKGRR